MPLFSSSSGKARLRGDDRGPSGAREREPVADKGFSVAREQIAFGAAGSPVSLRSPEDDERWGACLSPAGEGREPGVVLGRGGCRIERPNGEA